jgi:hypothetical protein
MVDGKPASHASRPRSKGAALHQRLHHLERRENGEGDLLRIQLKILQGLGLVVGELIFFALVCKLLCKDQLQQMHGIVEEIKDVVTNHDRTQSP